MSLIHATQADIDRFMAKVDKLPNSCWYWMGGRSKGKGNRKTYGSFTVNGTTVRAHRFAMEVFSRIECPPGHHRDHTCCFSMCVNPDHLELVSHEENQRRKVEKREAAA